MKETRFIAQNKEKWQESEKLLKESDKDPEKLSNLFTQVIDDLSYSRTYYPNRSVRVYLNKIAREYFSVIYKHQGSRKNTFKHFWMDELPQIVYKSRRPLLISLLVFLMSMGIGIFSSVKDPDFASSILGDSYVAMTKANIEKGDPMAVYKEANELDMFLGITMNNLLVAFRTYVFGVFLSIGTLAILLYNGIMVGCFQFFFIERNLFAESALTIWLHGTLEISSIILAGGAGLTLGSGLLFPGSYSRLQAFQLSAIRSLKLMLGITPIFVMAAIIESFLTRYTDAPDILRLSLILFSAIFIVGYFVVFPWSKARRGFDRPLEEESLPPDTDEPVSFSRIKNSGEIIKDSFAFYKRNSKGLLRLALVVTLMMATAEFFAERPRMFTLPAYTGWWEIFDTMYYALKTPDVVYLLINSIGTTILLYRVSAMLGREANLNDSKKFRPFAMLQTFALTMLGYAIICFLEGWGVVLILGLWIFIIMCSFVQHAERTSVITAISRTQKLSAGDAGLVFGMELVMLLFSFSFLIIISAPVLYAHISVLNWNFARTDEWSAGIVEFIGIFLKILGFNLVLPLFAASIGFLYFTLREINSAENLKKAISSLTGKYTKR